MIRSVSAGLPSGTRPAAYYPNRSGISWDGVEPDRTPVPRPRKPALVEHDDHICPDGTRITGIAAQHITRGGDDRLGVTRYLGHYASPDRFGIYPPAAFPPRVGDRRHIAPDTTSLDRHHPAPRRAAA